MADIIIDTCVIIDMVDKNRPRHSEASELTKYLTENQLRIRFPCYGFFEIGSALRRSYTDVSHWFDETLYYDAVAIDPDFIVKYYSRDLPYMKAGDSIFLAMAKVDGADLITEDNDLYKKAKVFGVNVYRISEYLDRFVRP